jgi:uncharacterized membrane protein
MDEELRLMLVAMSQRLERLEQEVMRLKGVSEAEFKTGPQQQPKILPTLVPQQVKKAALPGDKSLESAIGTKWIGRIGMIAILVGVGFLLKYSFDNRLIGETGRVLLGIITGISFLAAGEYFIRRRNLGLFGQILTGGGLSILYLSIYAAYAFYSLIPQVPALMTLIAITTTGITLSVRYSAIVIAVIGILGGFLTPVMLSTGENRPISLFSYILVLDLGILIVGYLRKWQLLCALSLLMTIIMYAEWHLNFYTFEQQVLAFCTITIFFILYNIFIGFSNRDSDEKDLLFGPSIISASALFYLLAFMAQNNNISDWCLKFFVPCLAATEIIMANLVLVRSPFRREVIYSYAGCSIIISVIAILVIFDRQWQAVALAAEMVVLYFIGLKLQRIAIRFASYSVGLLVILKFFQEAQLHLGPFEHYIPIINARFLICALLIASFYLMLYQSSRNKVRLEISEKYVIAAVVMITQVLTVYLLSAEAIDYFRQSYSAASLVQLDSRYARQLSLSLVWAFYASIIIGVGIALKIRMLRLMGMALIGITILKVFLLDLAELRTVYRIISFVVLGLILLGVSYFYNRFKQHIFGEASPK